MKCPWCNNKIPRDIEVNPTPIKSNEREELTCLRCEGMMSSLGEQKIQLGEHGFFMGDLSHLFSGALKVKILQCKKCSKLEFFALTNES